MDSFFKLLRAIEKGIRATETYLSYIAVFMLLALMFLGAGDIICRYIFNSPIFGALEFERIMMGVIVFLGWAYVHSKGGHVSVDLVFSLYPPRMQAIISFITLGLSLLLFGLIAWRSGIIVRADWQSGKLIPMVLIPLAPFKLPVIFGAFLLCLECLIQMIHTIPEIFRKKED